MVEFFLTLVATSGVVGLLVFVANDFVEIILL